jgi:hypothetical protein
MGIRNSFSDFRTDPAAPSSVLGASDNVSGLSSGQGYAHGSQVSGLSGFSGLRFAETPHSRPSAPPPTMPPYAPYPPQTGLYAPPPGPPPFSSELSGISQGIYAPPDSQVSGLSGFDNFGGAVPPYFPAPSPPHQAQLNSGRLYPFAGTSGDTQHRFVPNGGTYSNHRVMAYVTDSSSLDPNLLLHDDSELDGYVPAWRHPDGTTKIDYASWNSAIADRSRTHDFSSVVQNASALGYHHTQSHDQTVPGR